jgi:alcohol dehydrogenase
MKAVQINSYGDITVFEINENVPKPVISDGQVLVKIHAASINPYDVFIRSGGAEKTRPLSFPATLGTDIAGVVAEVGSNTSYSVGDKVYGSASPLAGGSGAFAEFAAVPEMNLAKMADNLDFVSAAALPITGISALQALTEHMQLTQGQKILIHGGAGGIGSIAIQIAKHIGAYVITTATGEGIEYVKTLGADEVIDYKVQKFEDIIKDVDAVFDTVAGETYRRSFQVLKKGSVIVSMIERPNIELSEKYGVRAIYQSTKANTEHLKKLTELVQIGAIIPHVDKVFPLHEIREAFEVFEKGNIKGKIVLQMN